MSASDANANASGLSRSIQLEIQVPSSAREQTGSSVSGNLAELEAKEEKARVLAVHRHVYYVSGIFSVVTGSLFFIFQVIAMRFYSGQLETAAGLWSGCAFGLINGSLALRAATSKQFSLRWARITFGFAVASLCMHILLTALSVLELISMNVYYDDYYSYRRLIVFMVVWSPIYGIAAGLMLVGIDIYYLVHASRLKKMLSVASDDEFESSNSIVTYLPTLDGNGTIQVTVKVNPTNNAVPQDRFLLLRRVAIAKHSMAFTAISSILLACWLLILESMCYFFNCGQIWVGVWAGFLPAMVNAGASLQHAKALDSANTGRRIKVGLTVASISLILFIVSIVIRVFGVVAFPFDENRKRHPHAFLLGMLSTAQTAYLTLLMNLPVTFAAACVVIYQLANLEALYCDAVGKSRSRLADRNITQTDQQNASEVSNELLQEDKRKYRMLAKHADGDSADQSSGSIPAASDSHA